MPLTIATLNILNTADRWPERRRLIERELASLRPDVLGIQEVDFGARQDERLAAGTGETYAVFRAHEDRPDFGNSLLVRTDAFASVPESAEAERVEQGEGRAAVVADLRTREGRPLRVATTHLHWQPEQRETRVAQVERLLARLGPASDAPATLVVGDFNATPDEPAIAAMLTAGFDSAHQRANGAEPDWTYPSPMTPSEIAVRGPSCIDYVFVRGARVVSARTAFDQPEGELYPSDHRGIAAEVEV